MAGSSKISKRLEEIVLALRLKKGMRVLEIGCGPGVAAREIIRRIPGCYVLATDRSAKAIAQAINNSQEEIATGRLAFLQMAVEELALPTDEEPFDIAFAIRVGALDGRHPKLGEVALPLIAKALKPNGKLYIDGGDPLREIALDEYR